MNKKPVIFRTVFMLIVIAIFAFSVYPLRSLDFYDTMKGLLKKEDQKINELIETAKGRTDANSDLYASQVVLQVAEEQGVDLTDYIQGRTIKVNGDVISKIKQHAAASIRLGIDLNGGVEFILKLIPEEQESKDGKKTDKVSGDFNRYRDIAVEILRNRLEQEKIFECEIAPAGDEYISLKAPIVAHDEKLKLKSIIEQSAKLRFRLVHEENSSLVSRYIADPENFEPLVGYERMTMIDTDDKGKIVKRIYFVKRRPEMSGKNVINAYPTLDTFNQRMISLEFNTKGAIRFGDVTSQNIGRQLAIVLDGKLYSAPNIKGAIEGGRATISGDFSREEAEILSNALVSGSLPVKIDIEAVFDTAPTLGSLAVKQGITAGIIGLLAVMLFMMLYYLRAGVVANIALLANIILVLGFLATFEATLTLPGIAGIILTIGMAVDANVLIYERIREELALGKSLHNAIDMGYSRAFTTILDANLTTLFTALILMWVGTGPIKGFAVTLSIGIATSMFTALFLTRLVFDIMGRFEIFSKKLRMASFLSKTNINFLGMRYVAATVSTLLIVGTLVVGIVKGETMFGIDFSGGTQITLDYNVGNKVPAKDIRELLVANGFKGAKAVYKSNASEKKLEVVVREFNTSKDGVGTDNIAQTPKDRITAILNAKFSDAGFSGGSERSIGGLIGKEFTKATVWAIIFAMLGIVIYISIRFEFAFAVAAIIAIIHDVIIATGIFILFGSELTLPVVAALLTIVGYSLNDTIVVFDRIREDITSVKGRSYKDIINLSINQTLSRTLLTSLTTMLVLLVLFFVGGIAINDFVFVMLVGVVVGTYSSIFVASPIVAVWHNRIGINLREDALDSANDDSAGTQ